MKTNEFLVYGGIIALFFFIGFILHQLHYCGKPQESE